MARVHAMIDIETLGKTPDSVILTIGGVKFDPNHPEKGTHSDFYFRFEVDEQLEKGRKTDESTIEWWGQQDPAVMEEALGASNRTSCEEVLHTLNKWLVGTDAVWAHGIVFDIVLMESLYNDYNIPYPWPFWKVRDSRTLFGILPKDPRKSKSFDAHNALEDARIQAECVQEAIQELGVSV